MYEYVNTTELAKMLGLSSRRVQQLTQDGILPPTDKDHGRKYNLSDAVGAYIRHLKQQADDAKGGNRLKKLQEEKLEAEIELKQSQGELHQLKTQIAQGEYISVDEAKADVQEFFVVFKKFALSIAPRVGGMVNAYVDPSVARAIEKSISVDVNEMLRTFVGAGDAADTKPAKTKKAAAKKTATKSKGTSAKRK